MSDRADDLRRELKEELGYFEFYAGATHAYESVKIDARNPGATATLKTYQVDGHKMVKCLRCRHMLCVRCIDVSTDMCYGLAEPDAYLPHTKDELDEAWNSNIAGTG